MEESWRSIRLALSRRWLASSSCRVRSATSRISSLLRRVSPHPGAIDRSRQEQHPGGAERQEPGRLVEAGRSRNAATAPCSFQMPSLLQAVTRKR